MVGNDDDYLAGLERAHDMYVRAGETRRAARCAFWIGHNLLFRANTARATGWFARAQRLQYEVVAAWQQFTDDGTLILQLGITTASARK